MDFYSFFNGLGGVALVLYNMCHLREKTAFTGEISHKAIRNFEDRNIKYRFLTSPLFWAFLETVIVSAVQYGFTGILNVSFGRLVGTGANYFGLMFAIPIMIYLTCLLLKIDPLKQMDLIAPAFPLELIFVKIACFLTGCCRGIPFKYGFYNPVSGLVEFPAQLLEAASALIIFILLLFIKNRLATGTVFPVYLMIYSAVRFFTEFLRCEPAVVGPLKTYQVLCCIGIFVGFLQYILVQRHNKKMATK